MVTLVVVGVYFFHAPALKPFIIEPVPGAGEQFTVYHIDGNRDTALAYKSTSRINIPANAFLYEDGKVAQGKIEVRYREFHDAVDIFLSGIPMNYDSGGVAGHLQSGGMLQFEASQNGKVLKPNPAHLVNMDFASTAKGNFNLYYLDTVQRKWVYSNQPMKVSSAGEETTASTEDTVAFGDTVSKTPVVDNKRLVALQTQMATLNDSLNNLKKIEPIKPLQANVNKRQFTIDVDPNEFPEITSFKDVLFEPEDGQIVTDADYAVVWEDVVLKENRPNKDFILQLYKGNRKLQILVLPVYDGENYAKAQKEFAKKYAEYTSILKNEEAEQTRLALEYQARNKPTTEGIFLRKRLLFEEGKAKQYEFNHKNDVAEKTTAKRLRKDSLAIASNNKKEQEKEKKQQAADKKQDVLIAKLEAKDKRQAVAETRYDTAGNYPYMNASLANSEKAVYNSFTILSFGIINCDMILAVKKAGNILAHYKDESNSDINLVAAYLLLPDYNSTIPQTCYSQTFHSDYRVDYYPTQCLLLAIDAQGSIFIYTPEKYAALNAGIEIHTFNMQEIKNPYNLASELRKYMKREATT